ncbi:hypothetical protein PR202_gb01383 [Eleusine coracana subsp. coracana]|uniref:Uncharacterized protein n=1 Tax=Eleusine coracana subsp. coracana TaxID=191504 RepID=A0AAV5DVQ9_ELECO|nr:hypothetical protein PR202_gb01383 [Eleusine coracana subsp. coracana]
MMTMASSRPWSKAEVQVFESALVTFPEQVPNRWAARGRRGCPAHSPQEAWTTTRRSSPDVDLHRGGHGRGPGRPWDDEGRAARRSWDAGAPGTSAAAACRGRYGEHRYARTRATSCRCFLEGAGEVRGAATGGTSRGGRWKTRRDAGGQHAQKYFIRQHNAATAGTPSARASMTLPPRCSGACMEDPPQSSVLLSANPAFTP